MRRTHQATIWTKKINVIHVDYLMYELLQGV